MSSTLSLVWTMGLSERISGWLQRRKEAVHRQRIYRASAYFGSLLKHGEADAVAVRRCVEDYKDFPEMTKRQVELLLEHGSLYSIRQAGRPEWQAVIETLSGTCYGRQTLDGTRHSVAEEAENPLSLLFARYEVLREGYENRRYKPLLPTSEIQARRNEAHRLLNYRMRESDLAALKDLALKGKRPEDSVILRHGLETGYRELDGLQRQWREERIDDDYPGMEQTERQMDAGRGSLMRQAAALYEEKLAGRLPGDYLEAVSDERRMLRELARNGWSERVEIPRETLVKYGLAEVFSEIASLRWNYHLSQDNGDLSREYPAAAIDRHSRTIREQAAREAEKLEKRLFLTGAGRKGHAIVLRTDSRIRPEDLFRREQKNRRQVDDTEQRKPVRRVRKF